MNYMPVVESMNRVGAGRLDEKRTAILFDKIKSAGSVQYSFLFIVFDNETQEPVYCVSSEVNAMQGSFGGGTHFLGVFDGAGHANHGSSDDWGDPRKFFQEALRLASEKFGVPQMGR
ncbi:MAG: hypothetical protein HS116_12845 [Planctomycetes bacterium]|nr:hypothetical protein [Planctomycetota bacterium]